MTPDEILTVVQAWKDGKPIQVRATHTEMGPEDYWEDHVWMTLSHGFGIVRRTDEA